MKPEFAALLEEVRGVHRPGGLRVDDREVGRAARLQRHALDAQDRRGARAMSSTARSQLMTPGATRCVITSESDVSSPIMPKGASSNSRSFSKSMCGAWSVTMASTVPSATPSIERGGVLGRAQRRVHLEGGVVVVAYGVLGEEQMVRRDLAGDGQALGLRGAHELQAAGRGQVLDVQRAAGEAAERDVAGDLDLLALGRPAEHPQARGGHALVHLALAHQVLVLAVAHHHAVELERRSP